MKAQPLSREATIRCAKERAIIGERFLLRITDRYLCGEKASDTTHTHVLQLPHPLSQGTIKVFREHSEMAIVYPITILYDLYRFLS